jgi:hypothetical protein
VRPFREFLATIDPQTCALWAHFADWRRPEGLRTGAKTSVPLNINSVIISAVYACLCVSLLARSAQANARRQG